MFKGFLKESTPEFRAKRLMDEIESAFKAEFPNGFYVGGVQNMIGSQTGHIHFGIIGDGNELTSKIRENDPAYHLLLIHNIERDLMTAEAATGGSLLINAEENSYSLGRVRFGWSKRKGTAKQILSHFTRYFKKVHQIVVDNHENIYNRENYSDIYFEGAVAKESPDCAGKRDSEDRGEA